MRERARWAMGPMVALLAIAAASVALATAGVAGWPASFAPAPAAAQAPAPIFDERFEDNRHFWSLSPDIFFATDGLHISVPGGRQGRGARSVNQLKKLANMTL